jgi:uncharacterized protein with HEPN domain
MKRAEDYIRNMTFESFSVDLKTSDAVIRCLEVIGEATKQIPEDVRATYPSIPWRAMAGMRDKIIHSYFTVDFEAVWLVIKEDIPKLKPQLEHVHTSLDGNAE